MHIEHFDGILIHVPGRVLDGLGTLSHAKYDDGKPDCELSIHTNLDGSLEKLLYPIQCVTVLKTVVKKLNSPWVRMLVRRASLSAQI